MSGLDFVITGGAPDTLLPLAPQYDRILTPGSVVLLDPIHSYSPMAAGLVDAQAVPNVAWNECAALLGAGSQASLAATFKLGVGNTAGAIKTERSAKGGINVVVSQTAQTVQTQGAYLALPAAILAYIAANPNALWYASRWVNRSRAALAAGPSEGALYTYGVSAAANCLFNVLPASGIGGNLSASRLDPSLNGAGSDYFSLATLDWLGQDPGTLAPTSFPVAWGQTIGSYQSPTYYNKSSSFCLERFYLENLSVSGRTWAQVDAIDHAFWLEDHTTGGRWYGDTYPTTPSSLP